MFKKAFERYVPAGDSPPKEGDLYKVVTTYGKEFELRYGYYEECDRENPLCDPVVIYPDFIKEPMFTQSGEPFVTMMQDACEVFDGDSRPTKDSTCAECKHFKRGEEWFGICASAHKRERKNK